VTRLMVERVWDALVPSWPDWAIACLSPVFLTGAAPGAVPQAADGFAAGTLPRVA
jgi:hypothetical protein